MGYSSVSNVVVMCQQSSASAAVSFVFRTWDLGLGTLDLWMREWVFVFSLRRCGEPLLTCPPRLV